MDRYDLAIIGSGPCGYVASIRAAQLGLKACVFEKDKVGGVCLNEGCIPTKALQASSKALYNISRAGEFGINVRDYSVDFKKVRERKGKIVKKLTSGIEMLMKARKIPLIKGPAQIKDKGLIVSSNNEIGAKDILIATGSIPFELPGMAFDSTHIVSSTDMLDVEEIPRSIVIVGGGYIGCEFASIFRLLGSEIIVVEQMEQLLPNQDEEIARKLEEIFRKMGIKIFTKTKVERIEKKEDKINAVLSDGNTVSGQKALVCVGRSPNSAGLGIEALGIEQDKGWIKIDGSFRTSIKNIYAAGDVKGGSLLAHVASSEGIAAVEGICGKKSRIDYNVVPSCIFTQPEIASVGINERTARGRGLDTCARKFLLSAIGKAHVLGETGGFIKLVVDKKTDKILGAQIIGPHAAELIAEISPCIQFGITSENLAGVIHAHPTLSEAVKEVSEAVHGRAIHSM